MPVQCFFNYFICDDPLASNTVDGISEPKGEHFSDAVENAIDCNLCEIEPARPLAFPISSSSKTAFEREKNGR